MKSNDNKKGLDLSEKSKKDFIFDAAGRLFESDLKKINDLRNQKRDIDLLLIGIFAGIITSFFATSIIEFFNLQGSFLIVVLSGVLFFCLLIGLRRNQKRITDEHNDARFRLSHPEIPIMMAEEIYDKCSNDPELRRSYERYLQYKQGKENVKLGSAKMSKTKDGAK